MRLISKTGMWAAIFAAAVFMPNTAQALSLTDGDEVCRLIPGPSHYADAMDECGLDGSQLYKFDGSEAGSFADSYSGSFTDSSLTITYDGAPDPTIDCPTCYLVVKDGLGAADGGWYIFDLGSWDGEEQITATGLFPGNGGISGFAIWGTPDGGGDGPPEGPAPEPASLLLLGTALTAFGMRMRRARS